MEELLETLLASWDRQTLILSNLAEKVQPDQKGWKPSPDGWSIDYHLAHIHESRYWWISQISPGDASRIGDSFNEADGEQTPINDFDELRRQLKTSAAIVREVVERDVRAGKTQVGPYSSPAFFLQHMIWHEGWHAGLITLALRLGGAEPSEDWEEANIWGIWRS